MAASAGFVYLLVPENVPEGKFKDWHTYGARKDGATGRWYVDPSFSLQPFIEANVLYPDRQPAPPPRATFDLQRAYCKYTVGAAAWCFAFLTTGSCPKAGAGGSCTMKHFVPVHWPDTWQDALNARIRGGAAAGAAQLTGNACAEGTCKHGAALHDALVQREEAAAERYTAQREAAAAQEQAAGLRAELNTLRAENAELQRKLQEAVGLEKKEGEDVEESACSGAGAGAGGGQEEGEDEQAEAGSRSLASNLLTPVRPIRQKRRRGDEDDDEEGAADPAKEGRSEGAGNGEGEGDAGTTGTGSAPAFSSSACAATQSSDPAGMQ